MSNYFPMNYDSLMLYQGNYIPSTVHTTNNATVAYFERSLFQKSIARFDFTLPEHWKKEFFTFILWYIGFIAVFNDEKYGFICQPCSFSDMLNIWFDPTEANVHTPLININNMKIGKDCEIIKLNPDWFGCWDIIHYYAEKLALITQSFDMNIENTKLAYFVACNDKADAETMKKMLDMANSGEPNVFYKAKKKVAIDKDMPIFEEYTRDIKNTYIGDELIDAIRSVMNMFNTEVGIPNANTDKKERLITDEVNANNSETLSRATVWLNEISSGMEKCNKLFGSNLSIRFHDFENGGEENAGENDANRTV